VRNTTAARWAASHLPGSRLTRVATPDDAFGSVRGGRIDAAIVDKPLGLRTQKTVPDLRVVGSVQLGSHYVLAGAADTAIMAPVDTGLAKLSSDGTLDELKRKWFGPGI
jgi:ABC-type amino acid transport substrate-binding protein